jgi:ribosomal protein S3
MNKNQNNNGGAPQALNLFSGSEALAQAKHGLEARGTSLEQQLRVPKIFNNNLNKNPKNVLLKTKKGLVGKLKYLPSYSKEWRNIIYSFNRNNLKNIPANDVNVNKIIKNYFDLFFKKKFIGLKRKNLLIRRKFLRRIFVSNVEIKHTNSKAKITLYTINREKEILKKKYMKLYKKISNILLKNYIYLYKNHIKNIYSFLCAQEGERELAPQKSEDFQRNGSEAGDMSSVAKTLHLRNEYFFVPDSISKKNYLNHKWDYLELFLKLNNLFLRKTLSLLIKNKSENYIRLLRRYNLLYSLNLFKFNKLVLLPRLSNLLRKIVGKKVEYNIINLKSIIYHPDLFTKILALKIQKTSRTRYENQMTSILNEAVLPEGNRLEGKERTLVYNNLDIYKSKYKDLKVISNLGSLVDDKLKQKLVGLQNTEPAATNNISELLTTIYNDELSREAYFHKKLKLNSKLDTENIHNLIYNSIRYKNMKGIKIAVKGRLTKRYRADRAVSSLMRKGKLQNLHSSTLGLSTVLFRGSASSHLSYSLANSKRRVGAFAVKGWIMAGK